MTTKDALKSGASISGLMALGKDPTSTMVGAAFAAVFETFEKLRQERQAERSRNAFNSLVSEMSAVAGPSDALAMMQQIIDGADVGSLPAQCAMRMHGGHDFALCNAQIVLEELKLFDQREYDAFVENAQTQIGSIGASRWSRCVPPNRGGTSARCRSPS